MKKKLMMVAVLLGALTLGVCIGNCDSQREGCTTGIVG